MSQVQHITPMKSSKIINIRLLFAIYDCDMEGKPLKEIRDRFTITDRLNLKDMGYIEDIPFIGDMRQVKLRITDDGRRYVDRLKKVKINYA